MLSPPAPTSRRHLSARLVVVLVALVALGVTVDPVAAAPRQAPPTTRVAPTDPGPTPVTAAPTVPGLVAGASPDGTDLPYLGDPRVDPDLGGVAVDTPAFNQALRRYRVTEESVRVAGATFDTAVTQLADLQAAEVRLVGTLNQATRRRDKAEAGLAVLHTALAQLAVDDYIRGDSALPIGVDVDRATTLRRQQVVVKTVRSRQLAEARQHTRALDEATALLVATGAELDDVRQRIVATTATRDRAAADHERFTRQLVPDAKAIADARLTGTVPGLDFSFVALDAYYKAAKRMQVEEPTCGIRWQLVAAVSRTEGNHGTFGGATLDAEGNVSKPIIGIALDGSNGTAVVADSDGGKYDTDASQDRAVGPMQFIPSTWAKFARDGNGDGEIDPQNIYDSAVAAAELLCYFDPGVTSDDGMLAALRHYNNDGEYGALVVRRTHGYDEFRLPPPPAPRR